jgi:mannose-6-phosphate isomerase-like protein (cupin superfamily)
MRQRLVLTAVAVAMMCGLAVLSAQRTKIGCPNCPATYISTDEIQAYVKRGIAMGGVVADQQVREVNVGKSNVAVGLVYRGRLTTTPTAPAVAEHDLVSEVYHIIDGSATFVTGPDIVGIVPRPADSENVRLLNGPGGNGVSIRNGVTHQLKAGDVVIVPAGTGHLFTRIDDHITYLMVRVDP